MEATTLGFKVCLSFPAGAPDRDAAVKVTLQKPAAGDWVSPKIEPASAFFAKPVTVVLQVPTGMVPDPKSSRRHRFRKCRQPRT